MSRQALTSCFVLFLLVAVLASPEPACAASDDARRSEELEREDSEPPPKLKRRPTITLEYGIATVDRDGFDEDESSFADVGMLDLHLGFRHQSRFRNRSDLFEHRLGGLRLQYVSTEIAPEDPASGELTTDLWRFGFGSLDGHGYRFNRKGASVALYHSSSAAWSFFDLRDESPAPASADSSMIEIFEDQIRFGLIWQGGVKVAPSDLVSLNIGYERSLVFPWTKFWYTFLSVAIEEAAMEAIDEFIDEIAKTSPSAVPVVEFLLKNSLSYGLYELRQEKMNWPFDTAAPLSYDTFKVGVSTTF
jgi:hypothetical protein